MAKTHRTRVSLLFAALIALTGLEIAVVRMGLPQWNLAAALIGLAWIVLLVILCFV